MHTGSCLCGDVRFDVQGELQAPDACHCSMCRKISGHYWASTDVPRERVRIHGEDKLSWYRSSDKIRRGFCARCGSALFWDRVHGDRIAIAMGAFDAPTDTTLALHIFVAGKGDYYVIDDGVEQKA